MTVEILKERYLTGRISLAMLKLYIKKGVITTENFKEITESEKREIIGGG